MGGGRFLSTYKRIPSLFYRTYFDFLSVSVCVCVLLGGEGGGEKSKFRLIQIFMLSLDIFGTKTGKTGGRGNLVNSVLLLFVKLKDLKLKNKVQNLYRDSQGVTIRKKIEPEHEKIRCFVV